MLGVVKHVFQKQKRDKSGSYWEVDVQIGQNMKKVLCMEPEIQGLLGQEIKFELSVAKPGKNQFLNIDKDFKPKKPAQQDNRGGQTAPTKAVLTDRDVSMIISYAKDTLVAMIAANAPAVGDVDSICVAWSQLTLHVVGLFKEALEHGNTEEDDTP